MKKYLATAVFLLGMTPLAGCNSATRPEWMGGEPQRPAADVKMGERREPVLQKVKPKIPMPPPPPPAQDYYSNEQMQMYVPPPPPTPPVQVAPDQQVMNRSKPARKTFPGDPHYSMATKATAPVPPPPEISASLKPRPAVMAQEAEPIEEFPPISETPMMKESPVPTPSPGGKMEDTPYPKLSDVPERPETLSDMKEKQAEKIEALSAEHEAAQEQREMLADEPAQMDLKPEPAKAIAKTASPTKKEGLDEEKKQVEVPEAASEVDIASEPKMLFPPGKYDEQLQQEQTLY